MGIFGLDEDEARRASNKTAEQVKAAITEPSALERAEMAPESGLSATATKLVARLLDVGIDGKGPFHSAHRLADDSLDAARGDVEKAIKAIQRDHRQYAAVGGFVTGLGGFFTMPVALPANILEFFILATRMTAATARLRGYDIDRAEVRTAILLTLVGADSDDILKKAGLQAAGSKVVALATDRLPAPALMVVNKAIGFRLLGRLGQGTFAKLGRGVPFVGGAVGAGVDVYMLGRIADQGTKEFPKVAAAVESAVDASSPGAKRISAGSSTNGAVADGPAKTRG